MRLQAGFKYVWFGWDVNPSDTLAVFLTPVEASSYHLSFAVLQFAARISVSMGR